MKSLMELTDVELLTFIRSHCPDVNIYDKIVGCMCCTEEDPKYYYQCIECLESEE